MKRLQDHFCPPHGTKFAAFSKINCNQYQSLISHIMSCHQQSLPITYIVRDAYHIVFIQVVLNNKNKSDFFMCRKNFALNFSKKLF